MGNSEETPSDVTHNSSHLPKEKQAASVGKKKETDAHSLHESMPNPQEKKDFAYKNADDYIDQLRKEQGYMSAVDHLEELRWRIIRSLIWIFLFSALAFVFYAPLWKIIMSPILPLMEEDGDIVVKMITTKLSDYVILQFKIALMIGFVLAIPAVLVELWGFVLPALKKIRRLWGNLLLFFSITFFWSGAVLGRIFLWPMLTQFMIYDWSPPSMQLNNELVRPEVHLVLGDYLSFFFSFHFFFGIIFQLPVVSVFLALLGILKFSFFRNGWRYTIVIISVLSAMITPPDIASMTIMMLPLFSLYIFSMLLVLVIEKFKKKKKLKM